MRKIRLIDVSKLREIIKYQVEGRGGKINPKDDFIGFIEDIKSCLTLPKEELDKEKVEKILESHITHVSLYHDKECGRVTQEQIIFKARFKETAQAIHDHFTLPKEEMDEDKAIEVVKNMEWDGNPNKLKINVVKALCQAYKQGLLKKE